MFFPIMTFAMIMYAMERGINYNLPNYVRPLDSSLAGLIYTGLRVIAPRLMFMAIPTQHIKMFLCGVLLYILAFLLKRAVWRFTY